MARVTKITTDRPETFRQAQTWETVKGHYEDAGLDGSCAGQAAYGHQMGFRKIKPPCPVCAAITLPARLVLRHGSRGQRWLRGEFTRPSGDETP
jgi:hypothetical protein